MDKIIRKIFINNFLKILVVFLLSILNIVLNIINTMCNGKLINFLTTNSNIIEIKRLVILLIVINICNMIVLYFHNVTDVSVKNKMTFDIVEEINDIILKKNIKKINAYEPVYLSQRIENDTTDVVVFLIDNIIGIFTNVATLLIVGYIFLMIDIRFVIAFVIFIPIYVILYNIIKKKVYNYSFIFKENQNKFSEKFYEQFFLLEEDKTHVNKKRKSRLRKSYTEFYSSLLKLTQLKTVLSISENIISLLIQIFVLTLGAFLIVRKELSIGSFVIITIYYMYAIGSLKYFLELGQHYQTYNVARIRLEEIINIEEELKGDSYEDIKAIRIYVNDNDKVIYNGKVYAIVGCNGSGKTTLIKSIYGIYNNYYIEFNGKQNLCFDIEKIRDVQFSILIQDEKTPNVKVIDYLIDYTELEKEYILKIMDTRLKAICYNEYFNVSNVLDKDMDLISRGEKQCILIIKTLIQEKKIYILDEFSNNMHFSLVSIIMEYINEDIKKNPEKIYLLVTHDKNIIDSSDEIIVV